MRLLYATRNGVSVRERATWSLPLKPIPPALFWQRIVTSCSSTATSVPFDQQGAGYSLCNDLYANLPSRLLMTPKPLSIAVRDFEKIIDGQAIKTDDYESAAWYRNLGIVGEEFRKRIWLVLTRRFRRWWMARITGDSKEWLVAYEQLDKRHNQWLTTVALTKTPGGR